MEIKPIASSSSGNCIYISDGTTPLLLDCGISIHRIKEGLNFGLSKIQGCLVTHSHADHSSAVKDLMKAGVIESMARLAKLPEEVQVLLLTCHNYKPSREVLEQWHVVEVVE